MLKQIIEDSDKDSRRKKLTKGEEEDLALLYEDCENSLLNAEEVLNHGELNQTDFIIKIQEISSRKNVFKNIRYLSKNPKIKNKQLKNKFSTYHKM